IVRDEDGVPYRTVVFWIEELLKQPVPTSMAGRYLELLQARSLLGRALSLGVRSAPRVPLRPPASMARSVPAAVTAPAAAPLVPRAAKACAGAAPIGFRRVDVTQGRAFAGPVTPAVPPRRPVTTGGTRASTRSVAATASRRPATPPVVAPAPERPPTA